MGTVTGIVQAKSSNKFGHGIMVGGSWYNSKYPIVCDKGDEIEFDDGGKNYANKVKVISSGGGASTGVGASGSGTAGAVPLAKSTGGYSRGVFPIPANDGTRSIVRQNSVTNAVNLVSAMIASKKPGSAEGESVVDWVLSIAREFEKYSSGDLDAEIVAEMESKFEVK